MVQLKLFHQVDMTPMANLITCGECKEIARKLARLANTASDSKTHPG
jgi:hypothetical protein